MPRVRVYLGCSLDGCIAGPGHDLSFLNEFQPDPDAPTAGLGFDAFLEQIGALLMGRRTYQVPLDHDLWFYGERPVFVATHRPLPPAPGSGNASALCGPIEDMLAHAKAAAGDKDVYLDGGDLVRQALEAGLVDELTLTFLPVVLGRGVRLWEGLQSRTDLLFEPPVLHGGRMVQITARVQRA
ncbi:MAG: dihydrofolate reductase family protein [Myxococcota bacterium]|nr:dihydrofolate reductase family protein [Myxococcota bacterium]